MADAKAPAAMLLYLLSSGRAFLESGARDKVFASLGIAGIRTTGQQNEANEDSTAFPVDYGQSLRGSGRQS